MRRSHRVFISCWKDWEELSERYNFNPAEVMEFSIDQGGGDSDDFKYIGDVPDE